MAKQTSVRYKISADGKTITEHVITEITKDTLQQSYVPKYYKEKSTALNK